MSWRQDSSASRCFSFLSASGRVWSRHHHSRGSLRPLTCRRSSYPPSNDARPVTLAVTTQPAKRRRRSTVSTCRPVTPPVRPPHAAKQAAKHGGAGSPCAQHVDADPGGHAPGVTWCCAAAPWSVPTTMKVRGVARIMSTDLIECLRACRDVGCEGVCRPDHYPNMGDESFDARAAGRWRSSRCERSCR